MGVFNYNQNEYFRIFLRSARLEVDNSVFLSVFLNYENRSFVQAPSIC